MHLLFFSGVHHKKKQCEATKVVKKVQDILVKAKSFLFPNELKVNKQLTFFKNVNKQLTVFKNVNNQHFFVSVVTARA